MANVTVTVLRSAVSLLLLVRVAAADPLQARLWRFQPPGWDGVQADDGLRWRRTPVAQREVALRPGAWRCYSLPPACRAVRLVAHDGEPTCLLADDRASGGAGEAGDGPWVLSLAEQVTPAWQRTDGTAQAELVCDPWRQRLLLLRNDGARNAMVAVTVAEDRLPPVAFEQRLGVWLGGLGMDLPDDPALAGRTQDLLRCLLPPRSWTAVPIDCQEQFRALLRAEALLRFLAEAPAESGAWYESGRAQWDGELPTWRDAEGEWRNLAGFAVHGLTVRGPCRLRLRHRVTFAADDPSTVLGYAVRIRTVQAADEEALGSIRIAQQRSSLARDPDWSLDPDGRPLTSIREELVLLPPGTWRVELACPRGWCAQAVVEQRLGHAAFGGDWSGCIERDWRTALGAADAQATPWTQYLHAVRNRDAAAFAALLGDARLPAELAVAVQVQRFVHAPRVAAWPELHRLLAPLAQDPATATWARAACAAACAALAETCLDPMAVDAALALAYPAGDAPPSVQQAWAVGRLDSPLAAGWPPAAQAVLETLASSRPEDAVVQGELRQCQNLGGVWRQRLPARRDHRLAVRLLPDEPWQVPAAATSLHEHWGQLYAAAHPGLLPAGWFLPLPRDGRNRRDGRDGRDGQLLPAEQDARGHRIVFSGVAITGPLDVHLDGVPAAALPLRGELVVKDSVTHRHALLDGDHPAWLWQLDGGESLSLDLPETVPLLFGGGVAAAAASERAGPGAWVQPWKAEALQELRQDQPASWTLEPDTGAELVRLELLLPSAAPLVPLRCRLEGDGAAGVWQRGLWLVPGLGAGQRRGLRWEGWLASGTTGLRLHLEASPVTLAAGLAVRRQHWLGEAGPWLLPATVLPPALPPVSATDAGGLREAAVAAVGRETESVLTLVAALLAVGAEARAREELDLLAEDAAALPRVRQARLAWFAGWSDDPAAEYDALCLLVQGLWSEPQRNCLLEEHLRHGRHGAFRRLLALAPPGDRRAALLTSVQRGQAGPCPAGVAPESPALVLPERIGDREDWAAWMLAVSRASRPWTRTAPEPVPAPPAVQRMGLEVADAVQLARGAETSTERLATKAMLADRDPLRRWIELPEPRILQADSFAIADPERSRTWFAAGPEQAVETLLTGPGPVLLQARCAMPLPDDGTGVVVRLEGGGLERRFALLPTPGPAGWSAVDTLLVWPPLAGARYRILADAPVAVRLLVPAAAEAWRQDLMESLLTDPQATPRLALACGLPLPASAEPRWLVRAARQAGAAFPEGAEGPLGRMGLEAADEALPLAVLRQLQARDAEIRRVALEEALSLRGLSGRAALAGTARRALALLDEALPRRVLRPESGGAARAELELPAGTADLDPEEPWAATRLETVLRSEAQLLDLQPDQHLRLRLASAKPWTLRLRIQPRLRRAQAEPTVAVQALLDGQPLAGTHSVRTRAEQLWTAMEIPAGEHRIDLAVGYDPRLLRAAVAVEASAPLGGAEEVAPGWFRLQAQRLLVLQALPADGTWRGLVVGPVAVQLTVVGGATPARVRCHAQNGEQERSWVMDGAAALPVAGSVDGREATLREPLRQVIWLPWSGAITLRVEAATPCHVGLAYLAAALAPTAPTRKEPGPLPPTPPIPRYFTVPEGLAAWRAALPEVQEGHAPWYGRLVGGGRLNLEDAIAPSDERAVQDWWGLRGAYELRLHPGGPWFGLAVQKRTLTDFDGEVIDLALDAQAGIPGIPALHAVLNLDAHRQSAPVTAESRTVQARLVGVHALNDRLRGIWSAELGAWSSEIPGFDAEPVLAYEIYSDYRADHDRWLALRAGAEWAWRRDWALRCRGVYLSNASLDLGDPDRWKAGVEIMHARGPLQLAAGYEFLQRLEDEHRSEASEEHEFSADLRWLERAWRGTHWEVFASVRWRTEEDGRYVLVGIDWLFGGVPADHDRPGTAFGDFRDRQQVLP